MNCPACNNTRGNKPFVNGTRTMHGVTTCGKCGAVFGTCYLGDSYTIVMPQWHAGESDNTFYFDLECLGSAGITRRHGWADRSSRRITQVG